MNLKKTFKGKKVLITGHTGFKGSWLTLWLKLYEAKILGISSNVPTSPSHFKLLKFKNIKSKKLDIRNLKSLRKEINKFEPDFIFHLAAQSLVKKSYQLPSLTWETNALGTLNLLESLRILKKKCTVIIITSDKVYKNIEIKKGYKEHDELGGIDFYSSSKASAELVINSYIKSFFPKKSKIKIGIARAGNVIGGGDWSPDRLIPDCIKSWSKNKKAIIRNPNSTRPWQHVLEALSGYLLLASKLNKNNKLHGEAFNFGPNQRMNFKVIELLKISKKSWKNVSWKIIKSTQKSKHYESTLLKLNSSKALNKLKWKTVLNFKESLDLVINWYKSFYKNRKPISIEQIKYYEKIIR